jgi:uncharacterized membrane protein YczE
MATDLVRRRSDATAAGVLMIVSGLLTTAASFGIVATWGWFCVGLPWLVPMGVGLVEVVVGASVLGGDPKPSVRSMSVAGLLAAVMCGNLIGLVLEIAAQLLLARAIDPSHRLELR